MLNKDILSIDATTSTLETNRRIALFDRIVSVFDTSTDAIFVSGSLATSANYGVHADSDIDTALLISRESVDNLLETGLFDTEVLTNYIDGYKKGYAHQFSLDTEFDGVKIECHFIDTREYLACLRDHKEIIMRFRSSDTTVSVNYGFSFDGSEIETELATTGVGGMFVSPFPLYIRENDIFRPGRLITNLLGFPHILKGEELLTPYIDDLWVWIVEELKNFSKNEIDLDVRNIKNAMPGNWKFTEIIKEKLEKRTELELAKNK